MSDTDKSERPDTSEDLRREARELVVSALQFTGNGYFGNREFYRLIEVVAKRLSRAAEDTSAAYERGRRDERAAVTQPKPDRRSECPEKHGAQCCNDPDACRAAIARGRREGREEGQS